MTVARRHGQGACAPSSADVRASTRPSRRSRKATSPAAAPTPISPSGSSPMFRRATNRYGDTPEPVTPYQKAPQLWAERLGPSRVQATNWRLMAFFFLAPATGLAAGPDRTDGGEGKSVSGLG